MKPTKEQILRAALQAVTDMKFNNPPDYHGPGTAAYLGVQAVLARHLSRAEGADPSTFTLHALPGEIPIEDTQADA